MLASELEVGRTVRIEKLHTPVTCLRVYVISESVVSRVRRVLSSPRISPQLGPIPFTFSVENNMLRRTRLSVLLGSAFLSSNLLFSSVVRAQVDDLQLWKQLDANADGWLEGRELGRDWIKFDLDGDNEVTKAEFFAGRERERSAPVVPPTRPMPTRTPAPVIDPIALDDDVPPPPMPIVNPSDDLPAPPPSPSSILSRVLDEQDKQNAKRTPSNNKPLAKKPSANSQPILGKMVQGKPVGFFYMQKYWLATRNLEHACWYFTADGRFYQNLTTGFSEQELAQHTGPHGKFQIQGNKLTFHWSDGKSTTSEMEIEETGFYWDTGSFIGVEPFAEQSIVGDYEGGTSSTFAGTSATIAKTLSLKANGTFELGGFASFRTVEETPRGTKSSPLAAGGSETSGRWEHDGFYLTLTFDSGKTERHIIFPFDSKETPVYPDRLFVSGIMYKKL